MKKLLVLLFTVLSFSAIGQVYELNNIVRNNTLSPARVANALDAFKPYTATGTDTYAISPGMNVYAGGNTYTTGDIWTVTFTNANTGAATLNVNADGAIAIRNNAGSALSAGEIVAGGTYILTYNGTHFRIIGATGSGGGGGTADLGELPVETISGTTHTVTDADAGKLLNFTNASGCTVTLPNTVSADLIFNFRRNDGAGVVTFDEGGTSVFYSLGNEVTIDEERAVSSWSKSNATDWYAMGGLGPLGGGGTWGTLVGTLSDQTDLQTALDGKKSATSIVPIQIACSDLSTALSTGTSKAYFRMAGAFTVTGVRASLLTAQSSGSILTIDINEGGTTILSTKLTLDNSEKTSTTAAAAAVVSDTSLASDAEITIDFDQVGTGGAGVIVTILGYYN